jgi:hypothetical protein
MPLAQIVLPTNIGASNCSTNQPPKAAAGCALNGRLFVSADFVLCGRFDTVELSFKGGQCTNDLSFAHGISGKIRTVIGSQRAGEDVCLLNLGAVAKQAHASMADLNAAYSLKCHQRAGRFRE